uniref:ARAD1D18106p n=1 Tax=Blastobotrys adeninivorans TaxID=409370 RepID=A0A060TAD9_BLAAD
MSKQKEVTVEHIDVKEDAEAQSVGGVEEWNIDADFKEANFLEHDLGFFQAVKKYPKAMLWSVIVSMTIVMEGYDTNLIGNFFAYPEFVKKYGSYYESIDGYQLSGAWQVGLNNAAQIGPIIGAFANGYLSQKFGFRKVMLASLVMMAAFIFVSFFAQNIVTLFFGLVLCGIPWGIFATMGPAYSSEICPLAFRGYLTAYTNMCFAMGQFIGGGVLEALVDRTDQWSYRIPFAVQWAWPLPLFIILWFCPESPWWLVRQGRYKDAEKVVKRLSSKNDQSHTRQMVSMMIRTNEMEQEIDSGSSWIDCFKGIDLRRTEIACVTFMGQVSTGSAFAYSASYFFTQAGLSAADAYKINLGGTAIAFIGTIIAWFLMARFGRRPIYITGVFFMALFLFIIGCLDFGRTKIEAIKWVQAVLAVLWLFVFSMSVGPVGWTVPSEVGATRLRQKTICLARICYYIITIVANCLQPYMINPTEWNWNGKTGFFWCGSATVTLIWCCFRLPETKNRTFAELDVLFSRKISARKFAETEVDLYNDTNEKEEMEQ